LFFGVFGLKPVATIFLLWDNNNLNQPCKRKMLTLGAMLIVKIKVFFLNLKFFIIHRYGFINITDILFMLRAFE